MLRSLKLEFLNGDGFSSCLISCLGLTSCLAESLEPPRLLRNSNFYACPALRLEVKKTPGTTKVVCLYLTRKCFFLVSKLNCSFLKKMSVHSLSDYVLSAKKPYCKIFVFEGHCNVVAFSVFKYLCIF